MAFATALLDQLGHRLGRGALGEPQDVEGRAHGLAADQRPPPRRPCGGPCAGTGDAQSIPCRCSLRRPPGSLPGALATFFSAEWPLKVRVGANSPSLWPTMFSVTNTGMNFRPLCTAKVWPTNSGRMVERRDQVFTTVFLFALDHVLDLLDEVVVDERALLDRTCHGSILSYWLRTPLPAPADDELVGALVLAGGEALGLLAPGRDRVRVALAGLAFATAVRVVDRVHGQTADGGADAQPAALARLADADDLVLDVAQLADGGAALDAAPCAPRPRAGGPARSRPPSPSAGPELPAERIICAPRPGLSSTLWMTVPTGMFCSGSALPGRMSAVVAGEQGVAHGQADRGEDVALLAVRVVEQRDVRRCGSGRTRPPRPWPARRPCRALEVDDAVAALVAAALVPAGDVAVDVAAARALASRSVSFFSGVSLVMSAKSDDRRQAAGGARSACTS